MTNSVFCSLMGDGSRLGYNGSSMPPPQNDLRVLIVADDPLARAGLATLIGTQPGYVVSGQTHWDADMATQVDVYRPDVAVWSLGRNPEQAVERLLDVGDAGPP